MTRTARTYYLVFGLYSASWSFLGPVYPLFLLSRGLDLFEINVVLAVYLITSFIFEVPTGAVADTVGRKTAFLLSCGIRAAAFGLYWFADGFLDCLFAELIDAIGTTLANGALDAWAVDGMRAEGDDHASDRFFARAQMIARSLMIVSGLVSGYVAEADIARPWLVAAAGFVVTGTVAAALMRPGTVARPTGGATPRSLRRTIHAGFAEVQRAPVLLALCLLTLVTAFAMMPVHMLWQARMQALTGQGTWLMGWIWALINLATLAGGALIPRLLGRFGRAPVLVGVWLWRGSMLGIAAAATSFGPALTGILCMEIGFGVSEPMLQAWMNEHVGSAQRATVLSVRAMAFTLGGGAGLLSIGLLARASGIPVAWGVSAVILLLAAPGFALLGQHVINGQSMALPGSAAKAIPPRLP